MVKIYNLTGKRISIVKPSGEKFTFEPERFVAKEAQEEVVWDDDTGIPTIRLIWNVSKLPVPQDGIVYIVTPMVLSVACIMGRTTRDLRIVSNAVPGEEGVYRKLVML